MTTDSELAALRAAIGKILTRITFLEKRFPRNNVVNISEGHVHRTLVAPPPGGGGGTLDQAYDYGGPGAGRTINTLDGAVLLQSQEADAAPNLDLRRALADVARAILEIGVNSEANPRLRLQADGLLEWGPGGATAPDVWLKRISATVLQLEAAGSNSGTLRVDKVEGRTVSPSRFHASEGVFMDQLSGLAVESKTISAGSITITNGFVTVLGEGGVSDDLDTIGVTAGAVFDGDFAVIMAENDAQTITLRHGIGNIRCIGGANIILDDLGDFAFLVRKSTTWYALGIGVYAAAVHTHAYDTLSDVNGPLATALGDTVYWSSPSGWQNLAGNITTTRKFYSQTGDGVNSNVPVWVAIASPDLPPNQKLVTIPFIISGGGSAITTGIKGVVPVDFGCTISNWTAVAADAAPTATALVVDIKKTTYAGYPGSLASITGTDLPTVAVGARKGQSTALTGWTTSIAAGDILEFSVSTAPGTTTLATISLKVSKT